MAKVYDEEGNELSEVFTKEELAAKEAEYQQKVKDLEDKAKLTDKEREELEKLKKKDMNFKALREKVKEKGVKLDDDDEEDDDDTGKQPEKKPENRQQPSELTADEVKMLDAESEGLDDEGKRQVQYFYRKLSAGVDDPAVRKMFMQQAPDIVYRQKEGTSGFDRAAGGSGGMRNRRPNKEGERTDTNKRIGAVLGVSDEDYARYGKKDWKPSYVNQQPKKTE